MEEDNNLQQNDYKDNNLQQNDYKDNNLQQNDYKDNNLQQDDNKNNNFQQEYNKILKRNYRNIIIVSVITFIIVFFSILTPYLLLTDSCSSTSEKEELSISNVKLTSTYSSYSGYKCTVTGTATNVSGKAISYASVEYSIYDSNGYNLGSAYDNISNLASGDKWNFEANLYFVKSYPARAKLADITVLHL